MHEAVHFLNIIGDAVAGHLLLPLIAWTVLWLLAELDLRFAGTTPPMVRYRAAQALMLALPAGLILSMLIPVPALLPASAPSITAAEVMLLPPGNEYLALTVPAEPAATPSLELSMATGLGLLSALAVLVSLIALIRLGLQGLAVRRLRRRLHPITDTALADEARAAAHDLGVRRSVEVILSAGVSVPMTLGLRRPLIVLPPGMSDERRLMALRHEMAHVRQYDTAAQWAEAAVTALFAFHPGMLRLHRHCSLFREMACDAATLAGSGVNRRDYASLLYTFASPPARMMPVTVGMADRRSHITRRIEAMMSASHTSIPTGLRLWLSAGATLLAGTLLVLGSNALAQAEHAITDPASSFSVTLQTDGDRANLTCEQGCAWTELSFTLSTDGTTPYVTYFGSETSPGSDRAFLFSIEHSNERITLTCTSGCAWTELVYECPGRTCTQSVNAFGMVGSEAMGALPLLLLPEAGRNVGSWTHASPHSLALQDALVSQEDPPIFFIDGVRATHEEVERLDPGLIESIEVIKGEAAVDRFGEEGVHGAVLITTREAVRVEAPAPPAPPPPAPAPPQAGDSDVFVVVEQMPEPVDGIEGIQRRVVYPELARRAGIEGTVFAQFVVREDGSVTDATCTRDPGAGTCEAAIAAIQATVFRPGYQRGEPVAVRMSLPVRFRLDNEESDSGTSEMRFDQPSFRANDERAELRGRIHLNGSPVEGARVAIEDTELQTATNTDGRYHFEVPAERAVELKALVASHAEHGTAHLELPFHPFVDPVLVLEVDSAEFVDGRIIARGRVVHRDDGSPVVGVTVSGSGEARTMTDRDGHFELPMGPVPGSEVFVLLKAIDAERQLFSGMRVFDVARGEYVR